MKKIIFLVLFISASSFIFAQNLIPIPILERRVTDLTSTLDSNEVITIETVLKLHEDSTGNQVVVLIIPTTGSETIEDYAMRVADEWKIGREGIDDGVILLVAKEDRELRLVTGQNR